MSKGERRAQLLAAARSVFAQAGASARIRDIAEAAGVNEALIYQHFRSKEELFDAAIVYPLERVVTRIEASAAHLPNDARGRPQKEATRLFVRDVLAGFAESVTVFGVVLFGEGGREFYRDRVLPMLDTVIEAVRDSLSQWSHRDFDPATVTRAVVFMCWGVAIDADYRGVVLDLELESTRIADLIFDGLLLPASRKRGSR
jgi:AcrR family transcriptional regulator